MLSISVANGGCVSVGDYVRIIRQDFTDGPPVGTVLQVCSLTYGEVRVPWKTVSGTYGKLPHNVERAYDEDYSMDEGL